MKKFIFTFLTLLLLPSLTFAAGAYLVDDGGIVNEKKIQIESWYNRSNSNENIFVTDPAYQLLENAEFSMQETYDASAKNINTLWPQVKYMWHKDDNISAATTVGINYSSTDQKAYGNYGYSSNTLKINDALNVNLYVGWQNWRNIFRNDKTITFLNYGAGADWHLTKKLSFIPEIFQTNGTYKTGPNRPATQFGLRYIANDNLILDTIYGHNINGNNQNWLTLGVTLVF
ncbi:MAG: hypothetical protein EBS06_00595 [Proteobacteria bacterium]|nr:hypothetical protein [Pseudomonadota bacterium]